MVFKLFGEIQLLLKPAALLTMPYFAIIPSIPTVNNLPILLLAVLKAVMKLSQ